MIRTSANGIFTAVLFAVLLHAVLFVLVRPSAGGATGGIPIAPNTRFLGHPGGEVPRVGNDPRVVGSPVLFSLPSSMGFSRELQDQDIRELMGQDVETRLTFSQSIEPEHFLKAELLQGRARLDSQSLMMSAAVSDSPALPNGIFQPPEKGPSARRVTLAPELMQRMVGGVVLPAELNREVSKPWEVRAEISVSEQGRVRHVFLSQPLESAVLNRQILQLLHRLEFNPGDPIDGLVEIYSPESKPSAEAAP